MPPSIQRPAWLFETTWIYHITAIDNLYNILDHDGLSSTNHRDCEHECIAHEEIQDQRARIQIPISPGGSLHDYVPFYFAPRSPMLRKNAYAHKRQDPSFPNAKPQEDIIHLVSYAELFDEEELPFVFYTQHAKTALAHAYNDIDDLENINWDLFFELPLIGEYAKWWHDHHDTPRWANRKSVRQAEFLVHEHVDWQYITKIGVINENTRRKVLGILAEFEDDTPVEIRPDWYHTDI